MAKGSPAYSSIVSARSKRLRTIGLLLLCAVAGMTIYGIWVLMPAIHHAAQVHPYRPGVIERKQILRVVVAYVYWVVWGLLLCSALVVAWLDLREVARVYAAQRRALWEEATNSLAKQESPQGRSINV